MKPKAIIVSGYFNPLHKGHLELFEKAKAGGDELWVIVNSDLQRELKGSKEFMDENERLTIVSAIKYVDKALISIDQDKTQCETLAHLADKFGADFELYFETGIDDDGSWLKVMKDHKLVKQGGSWYTMENHKGKELKFQSKDWSELLQDEEFKSHCYNLICDKVILKYEKNFGIDDVVIEEEMSE